jgi:N utilization substance protein A
VPAHSFWFTGPLTESLPKSIGFNRFWQVLHRGCLWSEHMNSDFLDALKQLEREKDIPMESLIETIETALASAYKKNYKHSGQIHVQIDPSRAAVKVYCHHYVVDGTPKDPGEISLKDALALKPDAKPGDLIIREVTPENFGRIAAQTAKQVVLQRLRDAERKRIFEEYSERTGEVLTGVVQRREGRNVIVNVGRAEAILPESEQVRGEHYRFNDRLKVYLLGVKETPKGPQIIVSRTHPGLIRRLFELEVPEIADGTVVIKSIAREPGVRTKMAVESRDERVDPVGACVGHRGTRVQAVVSELGSEKIDIVRWSDDVATNVAEALKPAKVTRIEVSDDGKTALVVVPDNQLSLAIGKEGQNVRLAAKLTGVKIDIRSESKLDEAGSAYQAEPAEEEADAEASQGGSAASEEGQNAAP